MTTFASWLSVDSRGPSAIYLVADSRISWGNAVVWDHGRKVFACRSSPDVFGYLGDVQFPSLVLGQICDAIDSRSLLNGSEPAQVRFEKIANQLRASFAGYPHQHARDFEIGYATRSGEGMQSQFHYFSCRWREKTGWSCDEILLPRTSDVIYIGGSGAKIVEKWKVRWAKSHEGGTSRAVFSSVCDAVLSGEDPLSGGVPQLVGIYRIGNGREFGFCDEGKVAANGMSLVATPAEGSLECRNRLFEVCKSDGTRIPGAQRHGAPEGLGRIGRAHASKRHP